MNKIKCDQCGKELEEKDVIKRIIRINYQNETKNFCSDLCATHCQMGAED